MIKELYNSIKKYLTRDGYEIVGSERIGIGTMTIEDVGRLEKEVENSEVKK